MTEPSRRDRRRGRRATAVGLLLTAAGGTLLVPLYARTGPRLGSFPFFYWYQLAWVPAVSVLCWAGWALLRPDAAAESGEAPR